ncbi:hypothetical protein DFJ77DRAFT_447368 [Powellomyces hirtus]|nr:hypothetical protein DFJ77DRAFT_447368 [Powellomyces hirtus]
MSEISQETLHAAVLLAIAKLKPTDITANDYVNLLLQPGAIEDGVNNIAQATRTLAPLELTQDVCRALQAGRDPVETFVQLNLAQRRKDYEREQELEARVKELEMDLTDTKRKLCEAELEVQLFQQKHREQTGTKKKRSHTYQKTKAAALAKSETAPFGEQCDTLRNNVEFLELVRLLLRGCELADDADGLTVEQGSLITKVGDQILKHVMGDVCNRTVQLGSNIVKERKAEDVEHTAVIAKGLKAAVDGVGPIALRIIAFASSNIVTGAERENFVVMFTAFIRDLIEMICAIGAALNDIRVLSGDAPPVEDDDSTAAMTKEGENPDMCQTLCILIVDLCRQQPILIPGTMLMLAEKCEVLTRFMRGSASVLPAMFADGAAEEAMCELTAAHTSCWELSLAKDDDQYAAASALCISYYFLYALEQMLQMNELAQQDGFVCEQLARACYTMLENSLLCTPPEYSAYAFRLCVQMQEFLGAQRFCVNRVAMDIVNRCLATASRQSIWDTDSFRRSPYVWGIEHARVPLIHC